MTVTGADELPLVAAGRTEALFLRHRRELVGLARLLTGSPERAEEVVQEAFVTLHRRIGTIDPGKEIGYLRRAVANQARSGWRSGRSRARLGHLVAGDPTDWRTPEHDAVIAARRRAIDAALAELSDRQRQCVALTYFTGLPTAEVAVTLGLSEGSVKTHLHRARVTLAPLLEDLR